MTLIEKFSHPPLYAFLGFDDGTEAAFFRVPWENKEEVMRRWNAFEEGNGAATEHLVDKII